MNSIYFKIKLFNMGMLKMLIKLFDLLLKFDLKNYM